MPITANVREESKRLWFIKNPIKINLKNKKSPCAAYELRTGFVAQQNYNVIKDMLLEAIQKLCQPNKISVLERFRDFFELWLKQVGALKWLSGFILGRPQKRDARDSERAISGWDYCSATARRPL